MYNVKACMLCHDPKFCWETIISLVHFCAVLPPVQGPSNIYIYIYLFACARSWLLLTGFAVSRGYSLAAVQWLLIVVASLVAEQGLYSVVLVTVVAHELSWVFACGIFLDWESNLCPCIGRQIPNQWITREVQSSNI